ncbi:sulfatase-like hydrolase/transferase [Vibrio sp. DW001]|uniref:sulfatase-like hydrolase/transferase n=1 Tax=Vibrio sp. DW001 TaxID=2912315 RepID=UPI0023B0ED60|nr:sulfatase-like hydrolase/transferase [Vibrio sp. DW001]WED29223.1 sulfatase-like hydrolase/transferase [Vibrio sp. DW001]
MTGDTKFLNRKSRKGAYKTFDVANKPNIFLITVDMISPDCYNDARRLSNVIHTPNLNQIAQEGTKFNRAFTPSPLCGPARAALFTGQHPPYLTNGERAPCGSQVDLETSDTIFQDYLKSEGYTLKHAGKCHVGVAKFVETFGENVHAWDRWGPPVLDDDRYIDYIDSMGVLPPVYKRELYGLQSDMVNVGNSFGGWIEQEDGQPFPVDAHYSTFLADLTIRQIKAAKRQDPTKPIFSQLDFFDPHQPYSIPAGFEKRYQEIRQAIEIPESFRRLMASDDLPNNPIYKLYRKYWGIYDKQTLVDYIAGHLLQVEVVDYGVGKLIDYLKSSGLWQDSLVIFSADHGDMNGRMGMADKGVYFQPDIFSIPLYVKPPQSCASAIKDSEVLVSSLDVAPTVLNVAGIDTPSDMEGGNLLPLTQGKERRPLTQVYQTGMHVGMNLGAGFQIELDNRRWFYGYNTSTGYQELYDLDIDDQVNLFYLEEFDNIKQAVIDKGAEIFSSDPRWAGYWASFRLHNMEHLPMQHNQDMQMLKPILS